MEGRVQGGAGSAGEYSAVYTYRCLQLAAVLPAPSRRVLFACTCRDMLWAGSGSNCVEVVRKLIGCLA